VQPDPTDALALLPSSQQRILLFLKYHGRATTFELAEDLGVSHEAVRRHLIDLMRERVIMSDCGPDEIDDGRTAGRPPVSYCLTTDGDHFFPKRYDELAMLLLDAAAESGNGNDIDLLAQVTRERLSRLPPAKSERLTEKVNRLQAIYLAEDPFLEIRTDGVDVVIVERNCPYLNVALERPVICSTTVSAMRHVMGFEVVREERFQDGDGCCAFRIQTDRPVSERRRKRFELEPFQNRPSTPTRTAKPGAGK
jgi:predicted ArsR family transcriptional regulator